MAESMPQEGGKSSSSMTFKDSEIYAKLLAMRERTYVDRILELDSTVFEIAGMIKEDLWEKKIKKTDLSKISVKRPLDTNDIPVLSTEFESEVKKKFRIKSERAHGWRDFIFKSDTFTFTRNYSSR